MYKGGYFGYLIPWHIKIYITLVIHLFLLATFQLRIFISSQVIEMTVYSLVLFAWVHIILSAKNDHFFDSIYLFIF